MEDQIILSHAKVLQLTSDMSKRILAKLPAGWDGNLKVYPVPRGGVPVAYLLKMLLPNIQIVDNHWDADIVVDDIIDSGRTRDHHNIANGAPCFYALIDKTDPDCKYSKWVVFPWELQTEEGPETVEHNITRLLQVQERLTSQIADDIMEHLQPLGVGVYISAKHMCLESRGVGRANSETITTAFRGCIKADDAARAEFLAITNT
jgi:hypothetical protein